LLYHLLYPLHEHFPAMNVFRYITFRSAYAAATALLLAFVLGPPVIERLKRLKIGQQVRDDGPRSHLPKAGTPTMGGILIVVAIAVPTLLWANLENRSVWIALLATLFMGFVGFVDDYLRVVRHLRKGLLGRYKLAGQVLLGVAVFAAVYFYPTHGALDPAETNVPFLKNTVVDFGWLYLPFVTLVITGASNAVNLADGLDGLASGMTTFAAFALGAPVGTALYGAYGFPAIALTTALVPLGTLLLVTPVRRLAPTGRAHAPFTTVIAAVWVPGVGLALSSFGFGAMTAFASLLFASRGWPIWAAFTSFAVAFIVARVFLGHLADRVGGARVALTFVVIEAVGLGLLWVAPWPGVALVGAALTGFGYSLVYPGFGVEAVRRAPAQSRGLAMGAYTAFLDLALALASPALGLIGSVAGIGAVFLTSAVVVLCAAGIAIWLLPPCIRKADCVRELIA